MHTGDKLLEILEAHGVEHIFGLPGEQTLPLYDAIHRRKTVRHTGMRDERNLPYAALAYARASGRVGVLDATVGPGTALLTLGLLEAHHSATPIVAILSDLPTDLQPMAHLGTASQGTDQLALLKPVVKWAGKAQQPQHVPLLVKQAFLEAATGRPGPTAVIIPRDVFFSAWPAGEDRGGGAKIQPGMGRYPRHRPAPEGAQLEAALALLLDSRRPVIVAGGGVLHSQATGQLLRFAEHLEIPVATTLTGKGAIAETHPLAVGVLGSMGTPAAEATARAADTVVLVGFRAAQNSTFMWTFPGAGQRVVHIDIDPAQPGRFIPADVEVVGDARAALEALVHIATQRGPRVQRPGWLGQVQGWKRRWEEELARESAVGTVPATPQRVIAELNKVSRPQDVLVADASYPSGWAAVYYQVREAGRRVILPRGMAGLGFGLPAGIGAKVALPRSNVFVLAGDGGFAYSLGELITLQAYGLNVISIVLNNRSWAWMEWVAKINYGREMFSLPDVPFARMAEALGLHAARVGDPAHLADALQDAVRSGKPAVIDVETAVWETPIRSYREALQAPPQAAGSGQR